LDTSNIRTKNGLENSVQQLKIIFDHAWINNSKLKRITKYSKEWWNTECSDSLNRYRTLGDIQYWKEFKTNVCLAKRTFFDEKIQEIAMSNKRPWDLMNWVKKKSLPAVEAILYEGRPCNSLSDLWQALHRSYNSAEDRPINKCFLNEIPQSDAIEWLPFKN